MRVACVVSIVAVAGCGGFQKWPEEEIRSRPGNTIEDHWSTPGPASPEGALPGAPGEPDPRTGPAGATVSLAGDDGLFRNTYYDFPRDGAGARDATLFDAACAPVAKVTQKFHDQVCVQGSGKLASGETVSFAKRDCACASTCPRTGQKICYERLDPARFPHGRGAMGSAITPLVTIAVDPAVIALGTPVFIQELVGLPRADGTPHDGCFVAQDKGLKVVGKHIDIFTGDPSMTQSWNARVPSNLGVHVRPGDARCARR